MKRAKITIDAFHQGLVPKQNVRNSLYLSESIGAHPYEGVLITTENLESFRLNLDDLGCLFPYPQIFNLSDVILICTSTAIYEYPDVTTPVIDGITPGVLWTVADYKNFILLTNCQVMVKKDPETGLYSIDSTRPFGTCVSDFNEQVFLTSPDIALSGNI